MLPRNDGGERVASEEILRFTQDDITSEEILRFTQDDITNY